ncbi:NAD-P-binding protein [Mycena polygramma]|nr:NAD-P-binding protein [Mycena polygramma]
MTTTIKQGSLVLVTGVNGFIASHVADQLLAAGYNVRGTTRSAEKAKWLYELFDNCKKYGPGRFAAVSVVDMGSDGAFDEAVKGVDGVVHLATIATFSDKVDEVVPPTVKGALEVLKSAAKEPRVRSVVYTSSSAAVYLPEAGKRTVTAIEEAHSNAKADGYTVYSASKAEVEKAVWQFFERSKPHFQVFSVIPDMNWGPILQPGGEASSSTASWLINLIRGDNLQSWYINVVDTTRLHGAALIDPSCNGKRIFAFGATYNWNDVLAVLRKQNPGREFIEDVPGLGRDLSEIPNQSAEALLKKHYQKGFTGLEETVRENSRGVV